MRSERRWLCILVGVLTAACPLPGQIRVRDGASDTLPADGSADTADSADVVGLDVFDAPDVARDVVDASDAVDAVDAADIVDTGPPPTPYHQIVGGNLHTCVLRRADGVPYCWGGNSSGQLGDGSTTGRLMPGPVTIALTATDLAAGAHFACAGSSTSIFCWGANDRGQLGIGTASTAEATPVRQTAASLGGTVGGNAHACQLRAGSPPACWGFNLVGQLGDGSTTNRLSRVNVVTGPTFETMNVGSDTTCATTAANLVYCWGYCQSNNCGSASGNLPTPTLVGGISDAVELAVGNGFTCARRTGGTVSCWGDNAEGQLGRSGVTTSLTPTDVPGVANVVQVVAGARHACARHMDGTVSCWGANTLGQLAVPAMAPDFRASAAAVSGVSNAVEIGAAQNHTCAIRATGQILCWGSNSDGQLGDSLPAIRSAGPVMVLGLP